ncbi:MAG: O-antigen ligase family protein [Gammaproteobacteria bacterium]
MVLTLTLLLATLLVAALLVSGLVPERVTTWLGCISNVLQLHTIPILGIYPSFALLCWLAPWRSAFGSALWRWPWTHAVLLLAAAELVSLRWSPQPLLGVRALVYLLPLPLAALALYRLGRERPAVAETCLRALLLGSALEAVLVIAFRLLPSVEIVFLAHPLARLFVPPNTLEALFYTSRNNVLDVAKAGGLFVNANIASAYLGMAAIAAWYLAESTRSTALRVVAVLDWGAVLFTGSKAGLLCALAVPLALAALGALRAGRIRPVSVVAAPLAIAALCALLALRDDLFDDFGYNTLATIGSREQIWNYALMMISQHPFAGLGFGGWEQRFELHASLTGGAPIPAHNSLFILWLQSGLPGVLCGLGLVACVYAALIQAARSLDATTSALALGVAGAFTWYFAQGLGENFGLIGEVHMTPLLGALLGYVCARYDAALETHDVSETVRSSATPSAIPAV